MVEEGWFEVLHILDMLPLDHDVEFPECPSQQRVEVVFYGVVCAE